MFKNDKRKFLDWQDNICIKVLIFMLKKYEFLKDEVKYGFSKLVI